MQPAPIRHVSDTAHWIAAYRALESARPDAAFYDPLAGRLAGERGMQMVKAMPRTEAMGYAMVLRTCAIDRLVLSAIEKGADTIINLGAGLDTRPYRLSLPAKLHWVEIDYPDLLAYKEQELDGEKPVCKLERIAADLLDLEERRKLLAQLGNTNRKTLIITEGLIGYLTREQAGLLSQDLFSVPAFCYWIQDYAKGTFRRNRPSKEVARLLKSAPWVFDVPDPIQFFCRDGWKVEEKLHILDEGDRIKRDFPALFPWNILLKMFPKTIKRLGNATYGYLMLTKSAPSSPSRCMYESNPEAANLSSCEDRDRVAFVGVLKAAHT